MEKGLRGANLQGAIFNLNNPKWNGFRYVGKPGSILSAANLKGTDLRGANLRGADLTGVDLEGALIEGVLF